MSTTVSNRYFESRSIEIINLLASWVTVSRNHWVLAFVQVESEANRYIAIGCGGYYDPT